MGDMTVGALIFLAVVWVLILGTTGMAMKTLLSKEKKEKK